jgi:hypothetical protein
MIDYTEMPCWGRELASILTVQTKVISDVPVAAGGFGLVAVERTGNTARVAVALVKETLTNGQLVTLLRAAAGSASNIQVFNEPEDSPFLARCRALGFREIFSQHEMFLHLGA